MGTAEFQMMLNKAIISEPFAFVDFDRTKNVQDQLQEMIDGYFVDKVATIFMAVRDYRLTQRHPREKEFPFDSMEQLWLAFVMSERYQKIWNGEDWIDEGRKTQEPS